MKRRSVLAGLWAVVSLCLCQPAHGADKLDDLTRKRIQAQEVLAFEPVLQREEVDALLQKLADPQERRKAKSELIRNGQGYQQRIAEFGHRHKNRDVRTECATIIGQLDTRSLRYGRARRLATQYRRYAADLLPGAWKQFRANPYHRRAVAVILGPEPEFAWKWLKKQGGVKAQMRYLLLRIRELSPDDFTGLHIFDFPQPQVTQLLPDVFPQTKQGRRTAAYRIIGHVALKRIHVIPQSARNRLITSDAIERVTLIPVLHGAFRYRAARDGSRQTAAYHLGSVTYGPFRYFTRRPGMSDEAYQRYVEVFKKRAAKPRRSLRHSRPAQMSFSDQLGLKYLSELTLTKTQQDQWRRVKRPAAWWIKAHVPSVHHRYFQFAERPKDAVESKTAGDKPPVKLLAPRLSKQPPPKPPADAPAVVILPPRLPKDAGTSTRTAAELVGNRLAQELATTGMVRVVDRAQLDKVLEERRLNPQDKPPLLSYDALLRIEADTVRPTPQTRITIIRLSTGNVLGNGAFPWPVRENDVPNMLAVCRAAIKKIGERPKGKRKLRWLGVRDVGGFERLRPLRRRLQAHLEAALEQTPGIVRVRHLEAADAKEESLLLLLGLSKLPGGRRFAPQADVTVELQLRELNAAGKTFENTHVEAAYRLQIGKNTGDWIAVTDRVKNFDQLPAKVWKKLSAALKQPVPKQTAKFLDELPLRRKQAEAEFKAAQNVDRSLPRAKRYEQQLARLDTALKLDPTFETASAERIRVRFRLLSATGKPRNSFVRDAARHVERFGVTPESYRFLHLAMGTMRTPIGRLVYRSATDLTADDLRLLDVFKQLMERVLGSSAPVLPKYTHRALLAAGRAMIQADVPPRQIVNWIAPRVDQCRQKYAQSRKLSRDKFRHWHAHSNPEWHAFEYKAVLVTAARLTVQCGQPKRAKHYLNELFRQFTTPGRYDRRFLFPDLRKVVRNLGDKQLAAEFEKWSAQRPISRRPRSKPSSPQRPKPMPRKTPVRPARVDVFDKTQTPVVKPVVIADEREPDGAWAPLLAGHSRLYILRSARQHGWPEFAGARIRDNSNVTVGYIPLAKNGLSRGTSRPVQAGSKKVYWDTITWLPQPKKDGNLHVFCAQEMGPRLVLGTHKNGLYVWDGNNQKWSHYGIENGLPTASVHSMFPIDNGRLYCTGRSNVDPVFAHFLFVPETGKSQLLHRTDYNRKSKTRDRKSPRYWYRLFAMWPEGSRWMAWSSSRLYIDLLGESPTMRSLPISGSITSAVHIDGRLFARTLPGGLKEFSTDGGTVRKWRAPHEPTGDAAADAPIVGRYLLRAGKLLVFSGRSTVTLYDPQADTWYGPVKVSGTHYAIGSQAGIWLGYGNSIRFVKTADVIAAAKKSDRVLTTAEFRKRRDAAANSAR